jgi:hypothetical protein
LRTLSLSPWRVLFVVAALFFGVGGPQHPAGSMVEMLAHSAWVRAHSLMLAGFVVLWVGLVLFGRATALPERSRRWFWPAVIGVALQAVEMGFHTAAVVDHGNLVAGLPTPVLTTHLWLAAVLNPVFAVVMVGLLIATMRDRVLGSPWIVWLGIVGVVAHGAAPPLLLFADVIGARALFPLFMLFAVWLILAACWPPRKALRAP